jgi:hypothetical protein
VNFENILASMGEVGELGEDPRIYLLSGEAKKRLISPDTGEISGKGEELASVSLGLASPNPAPIKAISPISPFSPAETENALATSCHDCTHSRRPGGVTRHCSARPELPPAYGPRHPLRLIPDDHGDGCMQFLARTPDRGGAVSRILKGGCGHHKNLPGFFPVSPAPI